MSNNVASGDDRTTQLLTSWNVDAPQERKSPKRLVVVSDQVGVGRPRALATSFNDVAAEPTPARIVQVRVHGGNKVGSWATLEAREYASLQARNEEAHATGYGNQTLFILDAAHHKDRPTQLFGAKFPNGVIIVGPIIDEIPNYLSVTGATLVQFPERNTANDRPEDIAATAFAFYQVASQPGWRGQGFEQAQFEYKRPDLDNAVRLDEGGREVGFAGPLVESGGVALGSLA